MHKLHFKPLTEEDRKRHEYLERINHAPYFTIFMIISAMFVVFTAALLTGVF